MTDHPVVIYKSFCHDWPSRQLKLGPSHRSAIVAVVRAATYTICKDAHQAESFSSDSATMICVLKTIMLVVLALYTDLQRPSCRDMYMTQLSSSCVKATRCVLLVSWQLLQTAQGPSVRRGSQTQDYSPSAIGTHAVTITLCKQECIF